MRIALVNPRWQFSGSIYFGCQEPHLPIEFGYAATLLRREGHEVEIIDAQLFDLDEQAVRARLEALRPDWTFVTTAPSYLFWRCAPPELRVPKSLVAAVRGVAGSIGIVGPHGSTTPRATLRKTGADVAVMGECEETIVHIASGRALAAIPSIARAVGGEIVVQGAPAAVDVAKLPALMWDRAFVSRHRHHHHRFDVEPDGPGGELEASRGCPYRCTFCAKENFRDRYRKRPLATVLAELDALVAAGATYVYFVDEIFLPDEELLRALQERPVRFGVQMRIDLFSKEQLELLGRAGCVSIEAGVESVSEAGRKWLDKNCRATTEQLLDLLAHAKRFVPFVQANLLEGHLDDPADVARFREALKAQGVWANEPVPLFPYPGSPQYRMLFGPEDDDAWERAHEHYLAKFESFSDVQEARPLPLAHLEREPS